MDINKSIKILEAMANGNNPNTGARLPSKSLYNSPKVIRAMFTIINYVKTSQEKEKQIEYKKRANNVKKGSPARHGFPWLDEEKQELIDNFSPGRSLKRFAQKHERTVGAVKAVLEKEGYTDDDFN